jgi:hypothetical protein
MICLPRHTSILGTLPLTETSMSTSAFCLGVSTSSASGVHCYGLADDETISNELSDGLAGVGIANLAHLIGVEPDFALSTADDGRRKALLGAEVDPMKR